LELHLIFLVLFPFASFSNFTLAGINFLLLYLFCFIVKNVECGAGLCLIFDSLLLNLNLNKVTSSVLKLPNLFEIGYFINLNGELVPWLFLNQRLTSKKSL
jgi:hypothetical protein